MATHVELAPAADEGLRAEVEASSGRALGVRVQGFLGFKVTCRSFWSLGGTGLRVFWGVGRH